MLQALRSNPNRQASSKIYTFKAPVGGLNARDGLSDMPDTDALILDNAFPNINSVIVRKGYQTHCTGMSTAVRSLMTYHALNGTEKLFAGANSKIYDVSTAGTASVSYSTSITLDKWQWVNFSNSAGMHLLAFNGTDAPLKYSGSAWSAASISGSISSINSLIYPWQHKEP